MDLGNKPKRNGMEFLDGQIATNCSSHTSEEWLRILQEKSLAQNAKLSWHQIKQDPSLNHKEIFAKLGPYANYEHELYHKPKEKILQPKVEDISAKAEISRTHNSPERPKNKVDPKQNESEVWGKAPKSTSAAEETVKEKPASTTEETIKKAHSAVVWLENQESLTALHALDYRRPSKFPAGCLGHIVGRTNLDWDSKDIILISKIYDGGIEGHIDLKQLEFTHVDARFSELDLKRIFAGLHNLYAISEVNLNTEDVTIKLNSSKCGAEKRDLTISFHLKPGQKAILFVGLVVELEKFECQTFDYLFCECSGTNKGMSVKVLESKYYVL